MERKKIQASDLITLMTNKPKGELLIAHYEVIDDIKISENEFLCEQIIFDNVAFQNHVLFQNISNYETIYFHNCTFINSLSFSNFDISTKTIKVHTHNRKIKINIQSCTINTLNLCDKSKFDGDINIFETNISNLFIENIIIENGNLNILNCHEINMHKYGGFKGIKCKQVDIHSNNFLNSVSFFDIEADFISFVGNNFKSSFYLDSELDFNVSFWNNIFLSQSMLGLYNAKFSITLNQNTFKKDLYVRLHGKFIELAKFEFIKNEIEGSCLIEPLEPTLKNHLYKITEILLVDNKINNQFVLGCSEPTSKIDLQRIKIGNTGFAKGEINTYNILTRNFELVGYFDSTNRLVISEMAIQELIIKKFTNSGTVQFLNCDVPENPETTFSATDSVLGNMQFRNFDINGFQTVNIDNTDLSTISISPISYKPILAEKIISQNTRLTLRKRIKNLFSKQNEDSDDVIRLNQERDIFRQLKLVCEKAGDRSASLYYKSYEMRTLHRELIRTKRLLNSNRLLLALSRTNSYGQNYWWPILWAFLFTAFFYVTIFTGISSQIEFKWSLNYEDWKYSAGILFENFPLMFKMLNPVYDLTKFAETRDINHWTWLFEYLHKLTLAFFVFQTISAFRKFVK
jgi:hypothetical protein